MNSILKKIPLFLGATISLLSGCNNKKEDFGNPSTFEYASYEDVISLKNQDEIDEYIYDVSTNDRVDNGVIISPYHTLKVNDVEMPLYATRTANGIHSFAYLNVNEDKVNLSVEITSFVKNKKFTSIEILPLSSNVKGTTENNVTKARLTSFGSFSFAFNKKNDYPVTIFVAKKEKFELPSGYALQEISPKEKIDDEYPAFSDAETNFTAGNTAYYFKKGHYMVHKITCPSNSILYFEPGVYLEDYLIGETLEEQKADYTTFMLSSSTSNVKVYGNPLVDYSCHWGGPANHKSKGQFSFSTVTDARMDGAIFINASSWQMCFTNCTNIEVSDCLLFGYRTCSDGIMLSDCKHGRVHHNFVRTGDDAIEAKSTGSQGGEDLIYEYNAVWADKARCYGIIYESNKDASGIIFRHNSIGFSEAAWTDDVGCLAVIMGTNKNTTWSDIHFEDIEIYSLKSHALCMSICGTNSFGVGTQSTYGGRAENIYYKDITVHSKFTTHSELVYMKVEEDCSLKKVHIENFKYLAADNSFKKFVADDLSNIYMTKCWTANGTKASAIAEVK